MTHASGLADAAPGLDSPAIAAPLPASVASFQALLSGQDGPLPAGRSGDLRALLADMETQGTVYRATDGSWQAGEINATGDAAAGAEATAARRRFATPGQAMGTGGPPVRSCAVTGQSGGRIAEFPTTARASGR